MLWGKYASAVLLGTVARGTAAAAQTVLEFVEGSVWESFATCSGSDSMPTAWHDRGSNTTYFMAADHDHMYAGTTLQTLAEVPRNCSGPVMQSHDLHGFDSGPQSYANFQWLQSIRVFANGTAAGLVHNEFKGEFAPLGTYCSRQCKDQSPVNASGCRDAICELWSTGLASSVDGGRSFDLVAPPPGHLVAALPHRFRFDQPISGYGVVSPMLRGADGAFYGSLNIKNDCRNRSDVCGNTSAGNCFWRADDLFDPTSFRARDDNGSFSVQWSNAYSPQAEGKGPCAVEPVSSDGIFGSHTVFRKLVPPANASAATQPTYLVLGDVTPKPNQVKYSFTYEADFGAALRSPNDSWTPPQYLDLDLHSSVYATLLDVRSPQLGLQVGSVEAQEDGDSFALVSYPTAVPPRPGAVTAVEVSGAGAVGCNGGYHKAPVPPGFVDSVSNFFHLDATHSLYQNGDTWHLAHLGVQVWYSSESPSPSPGCPPRDGWRLVAGEAPPPAKVVGVPGPNVTTASSLYLFVRGPTGQVRRNVQLRNIA